MFFVFLLIILLNIIHVIINVYYADSTDSYLDFSRLYTIAKMWFLTFNLDLGVKVTHNVKLYLGVKVTQNVAQYQC